MPGAQRETDDRRAQRPAEVSERVHGAAHHPGVRPADLQADGPGGGHAERGETGARGQQPGREERVRRRYRGRHGERGEREADEARRSPAGTSAPATCEHVAQPATGEDPARNRNQRQRGEPAHVREVETTRPQEVGR